VFLAASRETGFLPDLDALDPSLLDRVALFYLCSPANPQGAVAGLDYWKRALALARRHDFLLIADECYAEIYSTDRAPHGALEAAAASGGSLDNLLACHTLSKRSSAPGLRSGFTVGSPQATVLMRRLRTYACAATPLATLDAATALWGEEEHVVATRAEYRAKFDIAEKLLAGRFGFYRPEGGFYLWLDVGDGEEATRKLWSQAGVKVLPGAYLTRHDGEGPNPNQGLIRIALVEDLEKTEDALTRLIGVLQ
jgi:aspartate/methionine/tyrosine aminotransferase